MYHTLKDATHHLQALIEGGILDQPSNTKEKLEKYCLYTSFLSIDCDDVHQHEVIKAGSVKGGAGGTLEDNSF